MPRRKQKIKYLRKIACKHLEPKGEISHNFQPLCYCPERELVLGTRAYVCQVCNLYAAVKSNRRFSELFEESKKIAEKKIKETKIKLEIEETTTYEDVDLSIDEFKEEIEDIPLKFEKRKASKEDLEDSEEIAAVTECPFCGEVFDNLASHIRECEFAPDDANISDILPGKSKKKKKKVSQTEVKKEVVKQICPHCGKGYQRLGRHLNSCPKRPKDAEKKEDGE